eukprot:jgi/Ulvmu1/8910/UM005_0001.1
MKDGLADVLAKALEARKASSKAQSSRSSRTEADPDCLNVVVFTPYNGQADGSTSRRYRAANDADHLKSAGLKPGGYDITKKRIIEHVCVPLDVRHSSMSEL